MTTQNETLNQVMERELVITRVFDAPRELVFKAFTEPERLAQWWGPKDFTVRVEQLDLRPGGLCHYCMKSPEGGQTWGLFQYREISAPGRIVFVNSFSDAAGNITRAPFSEVWPLEILNTLTLSEQDGKTTLMLQGGPIHATAEERQTFDKGMASMQQGFGGTFDQLDRYLQKA
jgi:uncharacterized protein YndB with AHSA1/START domain